MAPRLVVALVALAAMTVPAAAEFVPLTMMQNDILRALGQANPKLKNAIHIWPRAATMYLNCNENAYPPFKDVRVRQALAYATDKEKLRARATEGSWSVAHTLLPPGIPGSDPNYQGLVYDPAKARALLAQAGYADGKGLPPLRI